MRITIGNMNGKKPSKKENDWLKTILIVIAFCIGLAGCTTTKYVPVVEYKTDTVIQKLTQRDSIYLHDSIHVSEKGDTVLIEKWHTKYRDREVHDTIYQSRVDSVPKPYPVTEYLERKMTGLDKFLIGMGIISIIAIIIFGAFKLRKFLPL